ncbi:MAG: tRNA (adenosine(37)-N6)-dimethylallyltransferase MiaA [Acidimicrobiia bacterium]|nr:tRNA (adenosine(37)-N6)-dimethylallyltransferase MiaA [Acidimicrobiia bacterium]
MTSVVALVGPTASGKSELAMRLALQWDAEIVSVDSMQVYRGMDIGTAKPTPAEQAVVPHHMIDVAEPADEYDVATFQVAARSAISGIQARGKRAIIVGGSGLHLRVTVDPYTFGGHDVEVRADLEAAEPGDLVARLLEVDPDAGEVVDLANPRRVIRALEIHAVDGATPTDRARAPERRAVEAYEPLIPFVGIGVDPGEDLADRARLRVDGMLVEGLLDEVEELAPHLGRTAGQAVGYKELLPVVLGTEDLWGAQEEIVRNTVALARRQRTYFRRDPRITWLPWHPDVDERYTALEEALDA